MMRKTLQSMSDLDHMPSLLGHFLRVAAVGNDEFDYSKLHAAQVSNDERLKIWLDCRAHFGMHTNPDRPLKERQQYVD